jgi:hypothetical protein
LQPHVHQIPAWVGLALTVVVCGGAFLRGNREQQIAAGGVLLSWLATLVLRDPRWLGTQWGAFGADLAFFALITGIAIRSPQYWPLATAAFQLLNVMTHVARMIDPGVRAWAYASGSVLWSQLVIISLGVGVWNTWRGGLAARRAAAE